MRIYNIFSENPFEYRVVEEPAAAGAGVFAGWEHMMGRISDDSAGLIPLPKPTVQKRVIPAFPFAAYKVILDG